MRRRLFTILSVLSLFLFVGVAALWLRSYRILDLVERIEGNTVDHAATFPGGLSLSHISRPSPLPHSTGFSSHHYNIPFDASGAKYVPVQHPWRWLGFIVTYKQYAPDPSIPGHMLPRSANALPGYTHWGVAIPFWFLMLLLAVPSCVQLRWLLRLRRRQQLHLCLQCGYDLRASTDRCPECGTPVGRDAAQ